MDATEAFSAMDATEIQSTSHTLTRTSSYCRLHNACSAFVDSISAGASSLVFQTLPEFVAGLCEAAGTGQRPTVSAALLSCALAVALRGLYYSVRGGLRTVHWKKT